MKDDQIRVRLDGNLKTRVGSKLEAMGLTHSTAVTMLYRHIDRHNKLPFTPRVDGGAETVSGDAETDEELPDYAQDFFTDGLQRIWKKTTTKQSARAPHLMTALQACGGIGEDLLKRVLGEKYEAFFKSLQERCNSDEPKRENEPTAEKIAVATVAEAQSMDHRLSGPEHLLVALAETSPFVRELLDDSGAAPEDFRAELQAILDEYESGVQAPGQNWTNP